jgi:ferric-dicitrate binding protein FerR (iron transport regulator)
MKLNMATLAYNAANGNSKEIVYNTLSTPRGGQYQLILQDGTKVWLNSSSSIHFPTTFRGRERKVAITGEAYFEVAKNSAMPFKITVKDVEVRVLGTHFNIMAYDDENSINTTLLEGSVKISKGSSNKMLAPGEESIVNKNGDINVIVADIEEVMAWKNGWFQFNAADIQKVMRQISRWYDVEIVYEGKIPISHFSGMISRGNNISQVLAILKAGGVQLKIEGRKIIVLS